MVRTAFGQKLARRAWLRQTMTVEAPSRSQTEAGDWSETWATVYAGAACYVDEVATTAPSEQVGAEAVTTVSVFIHYDPALTILPTYRITTGGKVFQVERVLNADETDKATARALVKRLAV